ncbi:MAG TPA: xanthine dehydrogenase family protein molybdopterin-binding subunit [Chloroflexota bacterium]|nr:xanthine dehydrogenase family protein molybdopterin-binding subunit [Chloroflexota bacterium]
MAVSERVDVLRAVQQPSYAARLTDEQWAELARDPLWGELVGEMPEIVAPLLRRYGSRIPGYARVQLQANRNDPEAPDVGAQGAVGGGAVFQPDGQFAVIGKSRPRIQGIGVVTGQGRYVQNLTVPGMLFMKTLRSPHPHARILRVDTSRAEKLPGVVAILHRGNLPEEYRDVRIGSGPPWRYIFNEEVFEQGAPVAAVAAESDHIADEALRLIEVDYEVLPHVLDFMEGMRPTTPKQWDNRYDGTILAIADPQVRGNPDLIATADVVVESVTTRSTEQHVPLELSTCICWWEGDRLVMYFTCQHAHGTRALLAQALKLPQSQVRVIQTGYMGSGYGVRSTNDLQEIHAAILAKLTGRPVRAMSTREEEFVTRTHRARSRNEMRLGVNRDGTIVAGQFKVIADVGGYRFNSATGSWFNMENLYKIPNLKLEAIDVFTNSFKTQFYRCVGHPNGTWALETVIEKAADRIGMDPLEFRLKNINEERQPDTGLPYSNPGIRDCLEAVAERINWRQVWHPPKTREVRPGVYHGVGLAAHACSHGAGSNLCTGQVVINLDGTLQVISGSTDIGCGQRTEVAMIAAETVGIPFERTAITPEVDTDFTTDTGGTNGSRQTNNAGWGIYKAALDAKQQLLEWAARKFAADARRAGYDLTLRPDELDVRDGFVFVKADPSQRQRVAEVVAFSTAPIIGRGVHIQDPTWERVAWGAHACEIEVDTVTGAIKILRYVAAHDVGRAINPHLVEQQIEGGVIQGIGAALTEQLLYDHATGLPLNPNILEYKVPSIKDIPRGIETIIIEKPKAYGVYGAHGIGEPPIALPPPTIGNALHNALGIWVESLPITREKVLAALARA